MSRGSTRAIPIILDDIGREFDTSDDEVTDNGGDEAAFDDEIYHDEEPNACSTVERLERSEEIHIGTRPSATTATLDGLNGATRWQVNRRFGERSVQCTKFIHDVEAETFSGKKAMEMLHRQINMDYGSSRSHESDNVRADDTIIPEFYLDYICVVGLPMKAISKPTSHFFDNIDVSLRGWHSTYSDKHSPSLPFHIAGRTFRVATASSREHWYIVMHPKAGIIGGNNAGRPPQTQVTAMARHHADAMASHIRDVFAGPGLSGLGINDQWTLGSDRSKKLSIADWGLFQTAFVEKWPSFAERYSYDTFWTENEPCFHAYDYGANIEIEVTDEMRESPVEDADERSDDESDDDDVVVKHESLLVEETVDTEAIESGEDLDNRGGTNGTDEIEIIAGTGTDGQAAQTTTATHGRTSENADIRYTGGLLSLQAELDSRYDLTSISTISYALAANLHCVEGPGPREGHVACMLADRNELAREYCDNKEYTFFPLGFHPAYGNISSASPPFFLLHNQLNAMKRRMCEENDGAEVVTFGHFQAYNSGIKQSIRDRPDDLLAAQGQATAALTIPAEEAGKSAKIRAKQTCLLGHLNGNATPENPEASTPFAREKQLIDRAIENMEFGFRMEQVVSVDVERLAPEHRNSYFLLRPVSRLISFYLHKKDAYIGILRRFPPAIFPRVLSSLSRMFELIVEEMQQRHTQQGGQGLGLALSEGIAALDRLGKYCFTGNPRVLPRKVFALTGSLEGLNKGGWPYINPDILDMRPDEGRIHIGQWPRMNDGRPVLMHTASLAFHYGEEVASNRHSQLWFSRMGGLSISCRTEMNEFLERLLEELFIPETKAFITQQIRRWWSREARAGSLQLTPRMRKTLEDWQNSQAPFQKEHLSRLVGRNILLYEPKTSTSRAKKQTLRSDFSETLYNMMRSKSPKGRARYAAAHATWPSVLQAAMAHTDKSTIDANMWMMGIETAMIRAKIEWLPGQYRQRLTFREVTELTGQPRPATVVSSRGPKREAAEDLLYTERRKRVKRMRVTFGSALPFQRLPDMIDKGFRELDKIFAPRDQKIREHYTLARMCIERQLHDPLTSLMLMITLTLGSSTETPGVDYNLPVEKQHIVPVKHKDPSTYAAALSTRMMWFLDRPSFPWDKNSGGLALSIPEMTTKIEHRGVNNRLLRELGWIVTHKNRPTPRNTESTLRDREELLDMYEELKGLLDKPDLFMRRIFSRDEHEWLERCRKITEEF